ncbi:unnamed protein product [Vicia faba]|uniref:Haloacid dehalogenase-like hydrolase domain-containing protein Sgpp n=1 Tax=Vicia faba TaxID=3906 RepID=A0AAV1ALI3_VICFA|nr:unnamed protein product [Vicia faba]
MTEANNLRDARRRRRILQQGSDRLAFIQDLPHANDEEQEYPNSVFQNHVDAEILPEKQHSESEILSFPNSEIEPEHVQESQPLFQPQPPTTHQDSSDEISQLEEPRSFDFISPRDVTNAVDASRGSDERLRRRRNSASASASADSSDQYAQRAKTLEIGMVLKTVADAVFMDCAVYAIVLICSLSLREVYAGCIHLLYLSFITFYSCGCSKGSLTGLAPLEAVLFDIDRTLCDSDPLHYLAFREMLQQIGFNGGNPITEEFFIDTVAGKHNNDIALALFPGELERGLKFLDDKEAMFWRLAAEQLKALNGLDKVRKWIQDRGLKRAAVTNAPRPNAELALSKLGLSDFFQAVIIGDECEHPKPHPEPYLKGLEALKSSKDHTFVFEDSVSGIKAGVAAGMHVIGLSTRNPEHLLMGAKPTFLIKDYDDPKLWAALEELDKSGSQ